MYETGSGPELAHRPSTANPAMDDEIPRYTTTTSNITVNGNRSKRKDTAQDQKNPKLPGENGIWVGP